MASYTFIVTSVTQNPAFGSQQGQGAPQATTTIVATPQDPNVFQGADINMTVRGANASVVGSTITVTTP